MSGQENKNFRIIIEVFNDAENKWKRIRELTGNGGVSLLSQEDVDTDVSFLSLIVTNLAFGLWFILYPRFVFVRSNLVYIEIYISSC